MFDLDLEKRILSGGFVNADRLETLLELVKPDYFYNKSHKAIFLAFQELYDANEMFDSIILINHLKNKYNKKHTEIESAIIEIIGIPFSINLKYDISQLKKLYRHREIEKFIKEYEVTKDLAVLTDKLDQLDDIKETEIDYKEFINQNLDEIFKQGNYTKGSLPALNHKINGYFNGQLITIAARPGIGKSAFAWQEARYINEGVAFFSLEMKKQELLARSLSSITQIEVFKIEKFNLKELTEFEVNELIKAHHKTKEVTKLKVFDTDNSILQIKNKIRKLTKNNWLKIAIIDYLQIIKSNEPDERIRFSNITRDLKLLAMDLNIPIVILSQLKRDSENRSPILSDLSGSGAIENNSDVVIFLHETEENSIEELFFIIAKNRKGNKGKLINAVGNSVIKFNKPASRFEALEFEHNNNMQYIHD